MTLHIEHHGDVTRLRMSSVGSRVVRLDVSAYVIRGVMIDTGFRHVQRELLRAARSVGVRGAILTHWHEDHAGNVPALVASGIPVAMRADTARILQERPAIQLYRRVVWGRTPAFRGLPQSFDMSNLECVHTPGHSVDHQVAWDPTTQTLFSGDLWLGVRARVLHASEDPYRIVESLRVALALEPARMFDAHRGLVERPATALRDKIHWLGKTLATIEERIRRGDSDTQILNEILGGDELSAVLSRGDYSRMNMVRAVRARLSPARTRGVRDSSSSRGDRTGA